jgi:hypothetical protein
MAFDGGRAVDQHTVEVQEECVANKREDIGHESSPFSGSIQTFIPTVLNRFSGVERYGEIHGSTRANNPRHPGR